MRTATLLKLLGGALCLVAATFAVLLARDVWHVENAMQDADRRAPVAAKLDPGAWSADTTIPFGLARDLLGAKDDLEFRALMAKGRTMTDRPSNNAGARRRLVVQAALARIVRGDDLVRASQAANLLGVYALTEPDDPDKTAAEKSLSQLVLAVTLDPGNEIAKENLELALQQANDDSVRGRKGSSAGEEVGKSGAGRRGGGAGY